MLSLLPAVLLAGCTSSFDTARTPPGGVIGRPEPTRNYYLIAHPKNIREDYMFPRVFTRQIFTWKEKYAEWEIQFPVNIHAHAGFIFRKKHDLSPIVDDGEFYAVIHPAAVARRLSLGVVAHLEGEVKVMTSVPLKRYIAARGRSWVTLRIPLSHFPKKGFLLDGQGRLTDEKQAMDWSAVRELRFSATEYFDSYETTLIRGIAFVR